MKKYYIKDNVCTPYKLILNRVNNYFVANGWEYANSGNEADIYIVGCCGAFHSLENEALDFLKEAKQSDAEVIAFGCLVRISPEQVNSLHPDKKISSPNWRDLEKLIQNPKTPLDSIPETNNFRLQDEYRMYDPGKQFVLIQTGCSSNCPYCPHKLGIGELKSRPFQEILTQVKQLTDNGAHTIVLQGNDTGSYGTDINSITYPELLEHVLEICPQLHLTQLNSDWVYTYRQQLFDLLLNTKIKEFQVLVQTASDRLLSLMERKPVVQKLYPYLKKLRSQRKDIILRTDIIIGYPTASLEEESETFKYVADLFDEIAVHAFERFPHTRIEKMGFPFYSQEEIEKRVQSALEYLNNFSNKLIHRGGQIYQTLIDIEKPKEKMRILKGKKKQAIQ